MENKEDRVNMSLDNFTKLYDRIKSLEIAFAEISTLLLNSSELTDKKDDLKIVGYDLKSSRILEILKIYMPTEYQTRIKTLLKDED